MQAQRVLSIHTYVPERFVLVVLMGRILLGSSVHTMTSESVNFR